MGYTLGQASKATGKSKATIAKAIASNRLSATKDEHGKYDIDPAELHRVYPPQGSLVDDPVHLATPEQTAEIERLKATVEGLEKLCRQIEGERDRVVEQNIRLTALLPPPQPAPPPATIPKVRRWSLFGHRKSA